MEQSILTSTKKLLGIDESYTAFDTDIIININSIFASLHQMGIGPSNPLIINDSSTTWDEFTLDRTDIESVKTLVYMKVRLAFDPPTNSFLVDSLNNQIKELEWRLYVVNQTTGEEVE